MISVLVQLSCLGIAVIGHVLNPTVVAGFFMGWCAALSFAAAVKFILQGGRW